MILTRSKENPILKPNSKHFWEAMAVFNACPIKHRGKIFLLYRALSLPYYNSFANVLTSFSTIGIVESEDGVNFENRRKFIVPEYKWEKCGCEDPRITKLNNKFYIFYTALSDYPYTSQTIKVGMAISTNLRDISEKHLVTPFNAKAMALFPEKINGKIWGILTVHTDQPPAEICLINFEKENQIWSKEYWKIWYKNFKKYSLPLKRSPLDHLEVGTPPIKTKSGWLIFISYIKNYFSRDRLFGVEAVLLDPKNPLKIIGRSKYPLLVPEEYYERIGCVPEIVFPSGAILKNRKIYLYYGAADTVVSLAYVSLEKLIDKLVRKEPSLKLYRETKTPIITPIKKHPWEAKSTFNPAAIYLNGKVHIIYRAFSKDNTSVFGYAQSKDGIHIDYRSPEPIYIPRADFEKKKNPGANSGCEDPRLTKIGNKIYMLYTAFDGVSCPRVALTWIKEKDFLKQNWIWADPILITPPHIADKDAFIFPKKVKGKYLIVHRVGEDIDLDLVDNLEFKPHQWLNEYRWILLRKGYWDSKKIGAAAPPIETKEGWIMFYHGVDEKHVYRIGAVLLDLKNPFKILARTTDPIFEPERDYEKKGVVPNVVFPCGNVLIKNKIFIYYGGADRVIGVATVKLNDILSFLKKI